MRDFINLFLILQNVPILKYLCYKYKNYIISLYSKIAKSLINNKDTQRKKYFVIDIIIKFISLYNEKYKADIDFDFILQCDEELNKIIETISNEILDLLFDNNPNLKEDSEEISLLNDNDDDNKSENLNDIILENKSSDNDEYLNIEEFYP